MNERTLIFGFYPIFKIFNWSDYKNTDYGGETEILDAKRVCLDKWPSVKASLSPQQPQSTFVWDLTMMLQWLSLSLCVWVSHAEADHLFAGISSRKNGGHCAHLCHLK